MRIRKSNLKDFKGVMRVVRKLHPKWFNKFAIQKAIPLDFKVHKGFVVEEKNKIVGFITYTSKEGQVKIGWIGVDPKYHRQGIGTKLLKTLERELKRIKIKDLRVETLAEPKNYKPYELTRAFYKKMDYKFEKIQKKRDEDTGEELGLAILVKKL
ncbi:MAG: GNAT family N-acetyltransferase [Candidatus Nealsonbacteria bacterium]